MQEKHAVVIVAAGRGLRFGDANDFIPKQYQMLGDKCVLQHCINQFIASDLIAHIQVVINADDGELYNELIADSEKLLLAVSGGPSRQESCANGIFTLAKINPEKILIHDAARPFVTTKTIGDVIEAIRPGICALPATPINDTIKRATTSNSTIMVEETVPRDNLYLAQTPQGFIYREICQAHKKANDQGHIDFTDDAAIAEWAKMQVVLVKADPANLKITTSNDLELANRQLQLTRSNKAELMIPDIRTGNGYDVHRLIKGDGVILCGVKIPSDKKLDGHSDADVAMHAITDALLGAIGEGDIGSHFPPSDRQWKNASSNKFLNHACTLAREINGTITHLDVSIICEDPKIGPHREAMRKNIAEICGLDIKRISVKATTNEEIGAIGRGEGIAAIATATVVFGP